MKNSASTASMFGDDEYVVYNTSQIAMKYLVEYSTQAMQTRPSTPNTPTGITMQSILPTKNAISSIITPLAIKALQRGLLSTSGAEIPLKAVTVKAMLLDLASEVSVFQKFRNETGTPLFFPCFLTTSRCSC